MSPSRHHDAPRQPRHPPHSAPPVTPPQHGRMPGYSSPAAPNSAAGAAAPQALSLPPQRRPGAWHRFSAWIGASTTHKVVASCGSLLAACLVVGLCAAMVSGLATIAGSSSALSATSAATPTHATAAPTPTPKPTVSADTVTLGGSEAAWLARYGDPFRAKGGWDEFPVPSPYGLLDILEGYDFDYNGTPQTNRITNVQVGTLDPTSTLDAGPPWDMATARSICTAYLPRDARLVKTIADPMGLSQRYLYSSALLANTLRPTDFRDKDGNQMPLGSITLVYDYSSLTDTSHVSDCGVWSGSPPD